MEHTIKPLPPASPPARRGSRRYVRRLQKRYMPDPHLDPDPPAPGEAGLDPSRQVRPATATHVAVAAQLSAAPLKLGASQPSTYCALPHTRVTANAPQVPVVFLSLLRKGTPDRDRSEAKLAEAFDYIASQVGWARAGWGLTGKEMAAHRWRTPLNASPRRWGRMDVRPGCPGG